jgi:L-alanine-DL-glutamate epimerase-like enolase superfamily enzyme
MSTDAIVKIEPIVLRIPFDDGGPGHGITPTRWHALDIMLLRVETERGLIGWGEGFGYTCQQATAQAARDMIVPFALGRDSTDPAEINRAAQLALHLFGRFGITMFAISALDIALWDIAAKRQGVSLARLLGGRRRERIRAYASLVRYGTPDLVATFVTRAVAEGYSDIKLHEITEAPIAAARAAAPSASITVDANCQIDGQRALDMVGFLKAQRIDWLEEPTFPPEDHEPWDALRAEGIAIAAGENVCTLEGFAPLIPHLSVVQPSVTKVGGVTEFLRVAGAVRAAGKRLAPHSPYFGPGYWATLQLAAALPEFDLFEYLYVAQEAWCGIDPPRPARAMIDIPDTPGIGFNPDEATIARYRVGN